VLSNLPEESPSASSPNAAPAEPSPLSSSRGRVGSADAQAPHVSRQAQAGAQPGPLAPLSWAAPVRSWAAIPWAGPTVAEFCFRILFCFIISQICVVIQKYVVPSI